MKTTKILIIWSLVIVALTHSFGQFTKFDPSKTIALDTLKYEVSYSLKKAKNKANLSRTIVDENGDAHTTNFAAKDTGEARQWIEANISLHDSIISKIDAEFTQMEQMQTYIRQEMDKIIDRKKALKRERVIAIRSKEQLKKLKL